MGNSEAYRYTHHGSPDGRTTPFFALGPRHYTPQQACKRSPPKSAPTRHTCARPARPDAPRARAKRLRERKSTTSIRAQRASSAAPQASPRATELPAAPIERSPQAAVPAGSAHAHGLDRAIVACHRPATARANGSEMARRQRAAQTARASGEGRVNRLASGLGSSVRRGAVSGAGGGAHHKYLDVAWW